MMIDWKMMGLIWVAGLVLSPIGAAIHYALIGSREQALGTALGLALGTTVIAVLAGVTK